MPSSSRASSSSFSDWSFSDGLASETSEGSFVASDLDPLSLFSFPLDSHPYSNLNELEQRGVLAELQCDFTSLPDLLWSASISARIRQSKAIVGAQACGGGKKLAKQLAAQDLLNQVISGLIPQFFVGR